MDRDTPVVISRGVKVHRRHGSRRFVLRPGRAGGDAPWKVRL